VVLLEMGVSRTICHGWPGTVILLISASQVARIIGMHHQCLDTIESLEIYSGYKSVVGYMGCKYFLHLWLEFSFS
jgi:hypothetical protein